MSSSHIQVYKTLAQVPALLRAKLVAEKVITSVWSQRNIEKGQTTKFQTTHLLENGNKYSRLAPVDVSNELLKTEHEIGDKQLTAILRDVEKDQSTKQFLEIWNNNNLVKSIDLAALELLGKVYTDDEFASFVWSPTSEKLLFVAEKFTDQNKLKKAKSLSSGEDYRQDWGEQLVGKIQSVLVIYDLEKDEFKIVDSPVNVCVAQPLWSKDGQTILGISYKTEPRKLGLIYCCNRLSTLFAVNADGVFEEFENIKGKSVKSPLATPDGKSIVWLENRAGGPHGQCQRLCKTRLPLSNQNEIEVVVDYVQKDKEIMNGNLFYGLYRPTIPKRCWIDDHRLVLSTSQKNAMVSYIIDIDNGSITEIEYKEGSQIVLDVHNETVLLNRRNFLHQDALYKCQIPPRGQESNITLEPVLPQREIPQLLSKTFKNFHLTQANNDQVKEFTAIYLGPNEEEQQTKVPLIVYPHGGPHSAFGNNFSLEVAFLLHHGYAIVMVNYRGSTGAGQDTIDYLPGRVGDADVADCLLAMEKALEMFPCLDRNRVALLGGSHGGFLVAHLSGQYPDLFRAVVTRNPVTDIATLSGCSDIPDWSYCAAGFEYSQVGPIEDSMLLAMRQKSPIVHAHKVKAATLLQIGTKDLRVPMSQGIDYFHRLRANNVVAGMKIYDDNHPLGTVPNEVGFVLSTIEWFEKYLK